MYDFTSVFGWHPIEPLKKYCGADATEFYDEYHPIEYLDAFKVLGVIEPPKVPKIITAAELAEHNSKKSCWCLINGRIHDLTIVLRWHPAGPESILLNCGKDSSALFTAVHGKHMLGHFDPVAILAEGESEKIYTPQKPAQISYKELSKHTSKKDCWLGIHGNVYDLTDVLIWHPNGARSILKHAGKDAS